MNRRVTLLLLGTIAAVCAGAAEWPVLRTYEGEALRRVKMPLGGIGTGTISLSGRGSLVDWELRGHPDKDFVPGSYKTWSPHFAIRCETSEGKKVARLLEGPILPEEYEAGKAAACPTTAIRVFQRRRSGRPIRWRRSSWRIRRCRCASAWRRFLAQGDVGDSDPSEPCQMPVRQRCVAVEIPTDGSAIRSTRRNVAITTRGRSRRGAS